jgi:prolipoprotein diacylglyceryl transferase
MTLALSEQVLAYIPSPPQGVWHVGPLALRAYALFIILGIVIAMVWGDRRWVARGGDKGTVVDVALWAIPFGFIGGRAYHVATDWQKYFGDGANPIDAFKVWQGGLGIWGAVLFGALGAWIGCRRKGVPLPAFGDAVAPGILLAQAIGRLGNYFNQELYGRPTDVPWGLEIYVREPDNLNGVSTGQVLESAAPAVHPTFLYELLWNLLIVLVLVQADKRFKLGHGRLFALYVAGYCAGRFWVELMRDDWANEIAGIRINIFTSVIAFAGAVVYLALARKGRDDPATLRSGHRRRGAGTAAASPAPKAGEDQSGDDPVAAGREGHAGETVPVAAEPTQDSGREEASPERGM